MGEDGVDVEPARAQLKEERVLGAHVRRVLCVAGDGEVGDRVLVLVLEEAIEDERVLRGVVCSDRRGDIFDKDSDACTGLSVGK